MAADRGVAGVVDRAGAQHEDAVEAGVLGELARIWGSRT